MPSFFNAGMLNEHGFSFCSYGAKVEKPSRKQGSPFRGAVSRKAD